MPTIRTERLVLMPATEEQFRAEPIDRAALVHCDEGRGHGRISDAVIHTYPKRKR